MGEYVLRAQAAGLSWPLPEDLDEAQLEAMLFPPRHGRETRSRPFPDWAESLGTGGRFPSEGRWKRWAVYHLARIKEALGDLTKAAELYRSIEQLGAARQRAESLENQWIPHSAIE